jgi:hypothetical protein
MKSLFVAVVLALTSSAALASGLVCSGEGYNVKLYNEVQPSQGTKNPAILIVSSDKIGTITRLEGSEIEKLYTATAVSYEGQSHNTSTGHFMFVRFAVARQATDANSRRGHLTLTTDGGTFGANLVCTDYLKGRN